MHVYVTGLLEMPREVARLRQAGAAEVLEAPTVTEIAARGGTPR